MTFEAYARDWPERQNFIKSTRKWTRQGLEVYEFPIIGSKDFDLETVAMGLSSMITSQVDEETARTHTSI